MAFRTRIKVCGITCQEDSRAAVVRIRRRPSDRFDNKISGTVWLDDFRLERVSPKIADNVSGE